MGLLTIWVRLLSLGAGLVGAAFAGCVSFEPVVQSNVDLRERPSVALLPFGFDVEITTLSSVKTVQGTLSPEEESQQVAHALQEIQREARWLLLSRLATGQGFRCRPRPRRQHLGLWENSLAVAGSRDVC